MRRGRYLHQSTVLRREFAQGIGALFQAVSELPRDYRKFRADLRDNTIGPSPDEEPGAKNWRRRGDSVYYFACVIDIPNFLQVPVWFNLRLLLAYRIPEWVIYTSPNLTHASEADLRN